MTPVIAAREGIKFDPKTFLTTIDGGGRKIAYFPKKRKIFVQGDSSDAVFYIKEGKVKLTVVSQTSLERVWKSPQNTSLPNRPRAADEKRTARLQRGAIAGGFECNGLVR
jgi:CRP-like cAMP-binding protein